MSCLQDIYYPLGNKAGKSLDQFLNELKTLATDCDFKTVSAEQYKSEMIRNVFINVFIMFLLITIQSYPPEIIRK